MKKAVKTKHSKKNDYTKLFDSKEIIQVIGIILTLVVIYNLYIAFSSNILLNQKIAVAKELSRPGELSVTSITFADCDKCYDIDPVLDLIKSLDVNVTTEKSVSYNSEEAKSLIARYNIEKLPTMIVTGEINKSRSFQSRFSQFGEQVEDTMIVTKQSPPYYDVGERRIVGLVTLTILEDESCEYCTDILPIVSSLEQAGIVFKEQNAVDVSSLDGQELVNRYNIEKVPALILDNEAKYYGIDNSWQIFGTIEEDNYVFRNINLPYKDLSTGEEKGVVHLTLIDDSTCDNCYDPNIHKSILARFGVVFASDKTVDVSSSEGQNLINKYNITKIPTAVLSKGASDYINLLNAWQQVGTIEDDGNFVFRNIEAMGRLVYRNLESDEIVNAA